MSNFLRQFGGLLVGVAAGFLFGPGAFSATAFSLGSMIGGFIFGGPPKADLQGAKVQKSAYGQFIPIVYGTVPGVAANIIDAPEDGGIYEHGLAKGGVERLLTAAFMFSLGEAGDGLGERRIDKLFGNGEIFFDRAGATLAEKVSFHEDGATLSTVDSTGMEYYSGYYNTRGSDQTKNEFWLYRGTRTQQPCPGLAELHDGKCPANRDCVYLAVRRLMLQPWDESVPRIEAEIYNAETGVSEIVTAHLVRGGCDPARLDLSDLTGTVPGCIQAQKEAPRQLADTLAAWRFCDLVEAGAEIRASDRTDPTIFTISDDELGAHDSDGGGEIPPAIKTTVGDSGNRPTIVRVRFFDSDLQGAINEVTAHRQVADEPNETTIDLPIVSDVATMQAWAQMALDELWTGGTPVELSLMPSRIKAAPGDVLRLSAGDFRIVDQALATPGVISCSCMSWSANPYSQPHAPGGNPPAAPTITPLQPPDVALIDTVALDADGVAQSSAGTVLLFAASMAAGARFGTPYLGNATAPYIEQLETRAVLGTTDGALTVPADISQFDDAQTVRVTLVDTTQTLETVTQAQAMEGANVAAIGQHIVKFTTADYVSPGVYDLSGFLFGFRGSEWAEMPDESKFVLLYDADGATAPGWKTITLTGRNAALSGAQNFTLHHGFADRGETVAANLQKNAAKALSTAMVRNETDGAGGTILKFAARIRGDAAENAEATGAAPALTDPLTFDVLLYDGVTLMDTRRVTSTSLVSGTTGQMATTYTAAQLTTIFGGVPATIEGIIYSSNGAGRGFGTAVELEI